MLTVILTFSFASDSSGIGQLVTQPLTYRTHHTGVACIFNQKTVTIAIPAPLAKRLTKPLKFYCTFYSNTNYHTIFTKQLHLLAKLYVTLSAFSVPAG